MSLLFQPRRQPLPSALLWQWRWAAVGSVSVALAGAAGLSRAWAPEPTLRWSLGALLTLAFVLAYFRLRLPGNHRFGEARLLPQLGLGTALTLTRGLSTALLAGFLFVDPPTGWLAWAPGVLYLLVAVADFLDGYAARVRNHVTPLGEAIDMVFDALGVLVAAGVACRLGQVPAWFLAVGLLYYLFHGHMKWRSRRGLPVHPLPKNPHRRMYAGFLFGYLTVALLPIVQPPATILGAWLFAAPVVAGFLEDWLVAVGRPAPPIPRSPFAATLARIAAAAFLLSIDVGLWAFLAAPLLAAGLLTRATALASIAFLCLHIHFGAPAQDMLLPLAAVILAFLLGGGRWALWSPEDQLLLRRAGAPAA